MYRAKRKDNGELIYGYLCYSPETERLGIQEMDISPVIKVFRWYEIDPDTIAMETGLTDKNGAMIYGSVEVDGVMRKGGDVLNKKWHVAFMNGAFSVHAGDNVFSGALYTFNNALSAEITGTQFN